MTRGWIAMAFIIPVYLLLPIVATAKPVEGSGPIEMFMRCERTYDQPITAFPSFHVVWAALAATIYGRRWPRLSPLWWLIVAAISDKEYKFKEGLTSYWEPKFETMLAYDGDVKALNSMIARLSLIKGVHVEVTYSEDLAKETHGFPPAGNWWVTYDHTKPETVTVRVNLAAKGMDRAQIKVPAGENK